MPRVRPVSYTHLDVYKRQAPWQIERGPQGELRAFGLRLPGSTLADAVQRWGDDLQVALIASRGQPLALEAYTERWSGGGITGKLVLATDAQRDVYKRQQRRSAQAHAGRGR